MLNEPPPKGSNTKIEEVKGTGDFVQVTSDNCEMPRAEKDRPLPRCQSRALRTCAPSSKTANWPYYYNTLPQDRGIESCRLACTQFSHPLVRPPEEGHVPGTHVHAPLNAADPGDSPRGTSPCQLPGGAHAVPPVMPSTATVTALPHTS
jgi:hypothetical protein